MEFKGIKKQYIKYRKEIDYAIKKIIVGDSLINGKEVDLLEKNLKEYIGIKNCISCASGTDALLLVLMAWNIKKGDAVFVPNFTFISTAEVVSFLGATPIFVDVNRGTFNIDKQKLEETIKEVKKESKLKLRAIIPVDLFGLPADYKEIELIAKKYNLLVLEDGAQSFGAKIKNKKTGSFGDVAITSFYPHKSLGCYGDGGAIFTEDIKLAEKIRMLKNHGAKKDQRYLLSGINSRIDTIQASILNFKLSIFEKEISIIDKIKEKYDKNLLGIVGLQKSPDGYKSSNSQYSILLKNRKQRDLIQLKLKIKKIPTKVYYKKPLNEQPVFKKYCYKKLPISKNISERILSLPIHPYMEEFEINNILTTIIKNIKK
jgi:UDP-2-acetamido-2-deoxy-ribo-hexuluronate aminotransferase